MFGQQSQIQCTNNTSVYGVCVYVCLPYTQRARINLNVVAIVMLDGIKHFISNNLNFCVYRFVESVHIVKINFLVCVCEKCCILHTIYTYIHKKKCPYFLTVIFTNLLTRMWLNTFICKDHTHTQKTYPSLYTYIFLGRLI